MRVMRGRECVGGCTRRVVLLVAVRAHPRRVARLLQRCGLGRMERTALSRSVHLSLTTHDVCVCADSQAQTTGAGDSGVAHSGRSASGGTSRRRSPQAPGTRCRRTCLPGGHGRSEHTGSLAFQRESSRAASHKKGSASNARVHTRHAAFTRKAPSRDARTAALSHVVQLAAPRAALHLAQLLLAAEVARDPHDFVVSAASRVVILELQLSGGGGVSVGRVLLPALQRCGAGRGTGVRRGVHVEERGARRTFRCCL